MNGISWHERWKNNRIGFHQKEVNPYLRNYWHRLNIERNAGVFVPLCGKSNDLNWLWQQGHSVLGVEISPIAVRAFFDENDITMKETESPPFSVHQNGGLKLLCGDYFAITPEHTSEIDAVYDRASLITFPPEVRVRYAQHLSHLIKPGCPMLLITLDYPQHEMEGPPFSVGEKEVHWIFDQNFSVEKLESKDALQENARFRTRGISRLFETVYALRRHST